MKTIPTLSEFQADHARFVELFVSHQCALMALDLKRARLALDLVIYEIGVHADIEDEVLMPIFIARAGQIEGGGPELFQAEHDKIRRLLTGLSGSLDEMMGGAAPGQREALELIEVGFTFKHLWDHHSKREDAVFYPTLDALMEGKRGQGERESVWKQMDAVDAASRARRGAAPQLYRAD